MTEVMREKDVLPAILSLLVKQQRLSENTSKLVESMVSDVGKFREQSERLAIVSNKLDTLEKITTDFDRRRIDCVRDMTKHFGEIERKREENKDRIVALEQKVNSDVSGLRIEMRAQEKSLLEKIEEKRDEAQEEVSSIREKVATLAGKYGAIVAGATTIGLMILKWVIDHHGAFSNVSK